MAEEKKRLIRGAEIVRFENSGHGTFIDEGDKLFEKLLKFHEKLAKRCQCKSQLKCKWTLRIE